MRKSLFRMAIFLVLAAFLAGTLEKESYATSSSPKDYIGSENCAPCHQIQYKGWVKTFHSTVIQDAKKNPSAILGDMTDRNLPFNKGDIDLTIGGHWDQRYLKKIGNEYYILPRLWSVQSKKWRPYSTYGWQRRPYTRYCVGCHSVGYDPETKTYLEHSVGCESCHGPGAKHSSEQTKESIVNPANLPEDRAGEICAACHVRGKDPSGEFFFPVGYTPGDDLSKFLVPLEKKEGESDRDAIHRLWKKWTADRESQARSRCEVCGIHQTKRPKGPQPLDAICMSCHEYEERVTDHTRHRPDVPIGCADCHEQKPNNLNETRENNVHSYGYFLIHPQNCWDTDIYKKCGKCHGDKTEQWAYDIFMSWKKPVVVDH